MLVCKQCKGTNISPRDVQIHGVWYKAYVCNDCGVEHSKERIEEEVPPTPPPAPKRRERKEWD